MSAIPQLALLDGLTRIASRAAAAILSVPRNDVDQRQKHDRSPVTAADDASEAVILAALGQLLPEVPVISEEAVSQRPMTPPEGRFLVVDPLDGTREFLAGLDEYTVNIALMNGDVPMIGVIAAPARGLIWRGGIGIGAERLVLPPGQDLEAAPQRLAIQTRKRPTNGSRVLVSRSHLDPATDAYIDRLPDPQRVSCGSALKFGLLAEGSADLYPRLSPTSAWDVAAGHAVLVAAGGSMLMPGGEPLPYRQPGFLIPAFIAFGDRAAGPPR
jgi:3'(2'), 5'-bisphosphate nucleotidase